MQGSASVRRQRHLLGVVGVVLDDTCLAANSAARFLIKRSFYNGISGLKLKKMLALIGFLGFLQAEARNQ